MFPRYEKRLRVELRRISALESLTRGVTPRRSFDRRAEVLAETLRWII